MKFVVALWAALSALPVMAQDSDAEEKPKHWSGESELGYSYENGNTNSEKWNFRQKVVFDKAPWKNTVIVKSESATTRIEIEENGRTREEKKTTTQRAFVSEKLDYYITDKSYAFGLLTWEGDRFSGFDHETSLIAGVGHELFNTDTFQFKLEVGVGGREEELAENLKKDDGAGGLMDDPNAGKRTQETVVYFSDELVWKFSEPAELGQTLSFEAGDRNVVSRFEAYLKSSLVGDLAMKLSYEYRHSTRVPNSTTVKADEKVLVSLLYSF